MKRNIKTKQTLLKFSTRIKKLMVMFEILKKDSKQRDINVPVFKFGVKVQNNVLERNDSQKKYKISTGLKCDPCDYKAKKL